MGVVKIDLRQLSSLSFEIIFLLIGFCLRDAQRAECGRGAICQCSGAHTFRARELCVERELRGQIARTAPSHVCVPSSTLWRPPFVGSSAKLEEPMQNPPPPLRFWAGTERRVAHASGLRFRARVKRILFCCLSISAARRRAASSSKSAIGRGIKKST